MKKSLYLILATVIIVTLKLTGVIDWSWWWVLAPLYVPGMAIIIFVVVTQSLEMRIERKDAERIENMKKRNKFMNSLKDKGML